jgi:hypothetical protein
VTTYYFGERWDAPLVDEAKQVPTPVGQTCYACGELIAEGDRGLMRGCMRLGEDGQPVGSIEPVHVECDLRSVLGHQMGVCPCTGHGSSRADALLTLDRLNAQRADDGMGPL